MRPHGTAFCIRLQNRRPIPNSPSSYSIGDNLEEVDALKEALAKFDPSHTEELTFFLGQSMGPRSREAAIQVLKQWGARPRPNC